MYMCIYTYTCVSLCIYVSMHVCMYVCLYVCVYVNVSVCVNTYTYIYICIYIYIYMYIHLHTYICTCACVYVNVHTCVQAGRWVAMQAGRYVWQGHYHKESGNDIRSLIADVDSAVMIMVKSATKVWLVVTIKSRIITSVMLVRALNSWSYEAKNFTRQGQGLKDPAALLHEDEWGFFWIRVPIALLVCKTLVTSHWMLQSELWTLLGAGVFIPWGVCIYEFLYNRNNKWSTSILYIYICRERERFTREL